MTSGLLVTRVELRRTFKTMLAAVARQGSNSLIFGCHTDTASCPGRQIGSIPSRCIPMDIAKEEW
jgi:hypothetical protein